MLYRWAYIDSARAWCRQNTEQSLLRVIAASWKLESVNVRELCKWYADVERLNHCQAHLLYKYTPRRTRKGFSLQVDIKATFKHFRATVYSSVSSNHNLTNRGTFAWHYIRMSLSIPDNESAELYSIQNLWTGCYDT